MHVSKDNPGKTEKIKLNKILHYTKDFDNIMACRFSRQITMVRGKLINYNLTFCCSYDI